MESKNIKVILMSIIGILSLFVLLSIPFDLGGDYYVVLNFALPGLILVLLSLVLFTSQTFQRIWSEDNGFKKVLIVIGNLVLIAITTFVSWIVLAFIGFSNGSYSMSTYGTPIYRPKIK